MDVSELQRASADLAGYLSEVTAGDLGTPVAEGESVGDLLVDIIERNLHTATRLRDDPEPARPDRATLLAPRDLFGSGYEVFYRGSADDALAEFADLPTAGIGRQLYADLVRDTSAAADRLAAALALVP